MGALSPMAKYLVDGKNIAVVATLMPDGTPQTTAAWVHSDGDRLLLATTAGTLKHKNLQRDSRCSLTVFDSADPYLELNVRGRAVELDSVGGLELINRLSEKYYGTTPYPYLKPDDEWVRVVIEVERSRTNREL